MLEYLYLARWDQAYDFLGSGNPPVFVRLMAVNALFLALFGVRKAAGARPMSSLAMLLTQLAWLGGNLLVLYQPQVEDYVRSLTSPF